MVGDIQDIRSKIAKHQEDLEKELADNQTKIDNQLDDIHTRMTEAIEKAKQEAIDNQCCGGCTIL